MNTIQFLWTQPWVERLGWTLVHFLWQGTLIALLYSIARWCSGRERSAQVRYFLGCAALIAMLAAPVVTFSLTGSPHSIARGSSSLSPHSPSINATGSVPVETPVTFIFGAWQDNLMPWFVITWFTGMLILWLRLIGSWIVATRTSSVMVRPAPAEWERTLNRLCTRISVSAPAKLLVSAVVEVPTVVGWLRPIILMPIGALAGLPPEHVEALLAHEIAHIRRHDYLVNILQGVAEALLFYHPAVWWISSDIRKERELCCDDVAVAITGDAFTYAQALADLESYRAAHLSLALAANGGSLAERIARLLCVRRADERPTPVAALFASGVLVFLIAIAALAESAPTLKFEVASVNQRLRSTSDFSPT